MALALWLAAATPSVARGDDLLQYLESRGLDTLAMQRLEDLSRAASPDDRAQYFERLGALVIRLLDASAEGETQQRLLARADALADTVAGAGSDNLRIAAARVRYRSGARVAETIRAGGTGDTAAAAEMLARQAEILLATSERAEKRALELDRKLEREQGVGRDLVSRQVDAARALSGQARYLAAWSLLYRAMLARSQSDAERAQKLFIALLGGRDGELSPAEVSEDLRSDEAFASAILGLSLAKARLAGFSEASRWLALLEAKDAHASVRSALTGWTMVAALDGGAFKAARTAFAKLAAREDSASWARIAVARAVEDGGADGDATLLAREALAQLAAVRELGALRALVERYGEGILGDDRTGFVPRYVQAVRLYDEAQRAVAAAGSDRTKLASEDVRAPSRAAAQALDETLKAEDAAAYADAVVSCRLMRAWSLRGAGSFAEAAKAFDGVAASSVGARAEEAARLAIASLDDARSESTDAAERTRLDTELVARIDAFLSRFPGSDFAPELLVRKVAASGAPADEDIDALLAVPKESDDWLPSRRQALFALYRVFRGASTQREATAKRYLAVLAELPRDADTQLPASSAAIARQALEVALASEVRDLELAASLLEALARAGARGEFDLREADEELAYRRLQLSIYANRWVDVEASLAAFEKPEATALWADAALRLAVRGAEVRRRSSPSDAPERAGLVSTIIRASDALFEREGGVQKALAPDAKGSSPLAQIARVALDAREELLRTSSDADEAKRGLRLAEAILATAPRDAAVLRSAAVCAEVAGDASRAADFLRVLVGGLPPRTKPWFEAKLDQIRVLAKVDPVRARAVLAQHRALYPELAPEPFRARFLELEKSLPPEAGDAADGKGATP